MAPKAAPPHRGGRGRLKGVNRELLIARLRKSKATCLRIAGEAVREFAEEVAARSCVRAAAIKV